MITFIKQTISYDEVAIIIAKSMGNLELNKEIYVDESKITAAEFELLKKYLEQENYIQQ